MNLWDGQSDVLEQNARLSEGKRVTPDVSSSVELLRGSQPCPHLGLQSLHRRLTTWLHIKMTHGASKAPDTPCS